MFSKLTIRSRILLLLAFLAIVAAGISSLVGYVIAHRSLETQAFQQLTALREMKASQVENYFAQIRNQILTFSNNPMTVAAMKAFKLTFYSMEMDWGQDDAQKAARTLELKRYYTEQFLPKLEKNYPGEVSLTDYWPASRAQVAQYLYISDNPFETGAKENLDRSSKEFRYNYIHGRYHAFIRDFLRKFGYYDIFLIDSATGNIVYSVFKEVDFGTSLLSGPYRNSNLARAFQAAKLSHSPDFVKLIDFEPYDPSYHSQASFVVSPIYDDGQMIGVLAFQMPVDRINNIMTNNNSWADIGLGRSGETYIVGYDFKLRSQSRFLIEQKDEYLQALKKQNVSADTIERIESLGQAIGIQEVKTPGALKALEGLSGTLIFKDYRGVEVLSSFRQLNIPDVDWAIMSEIDRAEALAGATALRNYMLIWMVMVAMGSGLAAIVFSKKLTQPLIALSEKAKSLARGELDVEIDTRGHGEIADLSQSFDAMRLSIKELVDRQAEVIDALSTPLIPLEDDVVVMPLVGEFDGRRIEQMRKTFIDGIYKAGARVAIIDLTGVPIYTAELAVGMRKALEAAHLLGAEVVMTGMQAEVAKGLTDSDGMFQGVVTRRSLQDGIDFAATHTRKADIGGSSQKRS